MIGNPQHELQNIKNELQSIIHELSSIEDGIRYEFSGISSDKCANRLSEAKRQCETNLRKLYSAKIDDADSSGVISGGRF